MSTVNKSILNCDIQNSQDLGCNMYPPKKTWCMECCIELQGNYKPI